MARPYLTIFAALLALTLVTVFVASLHLPPVPTVTIGLAIASAKAALVIMFFMHLKGEKPMVYWPLALTMFLFVALFAFILWSEADHISISMNFDGSIDAPIDPMNGLMHHWYNDSIDGPIIDHRYGLPDMSCPVCFNAVEPSIRESMNAGIFVLLGVTGVVLACFAAFFISLARRARAATHLVGAAPAHAEPR